jgi:hypothetical protein
MRRPVAAIALVVLALAGCGGHRSAAEALQACVGKRLPGGPADHITASTVAGVTSVAFFQGGGEETDLTIFPSVNAAMAGEHAEARIGDAHDRRLANVLFTGGSAVESAIAACVH